ncbi:MAG: DUF1080 domain-containing protein, partial [Verrucomicrobia bacterium]|nr:DUF1080 domain-containing protein [Verrucomicrobiota bacterium]
GLEFQMLDDAVHPDAKLGRNGNRTVSSLYDLITASKDKRPNRIGEWNHVKVEANGNRIRTWLNGVQRVDVRDDGYPNGFIAFQVHGIGKDKTKEGTTVQWRNISLTKISDNSLTPSEKEDGWKLLFDGKTSKGWRSAKGPEFPKEGWSVEKGMLHTAASGGKESAAAGDIITIARFKQFEVSVDFKLTKGANSGLKYYVQPDLNQGAGSAFGLEFQMLDDAVHPDAKLGRNGNRTVSSLYDLITASKDKRPNRIGEWNLRDHQRHQSGTLAQRTPRRCVRPFDRRIPRPGLKKQIC